MPHGMYKMKTTPTFVVSSLMCWSGNMELGQNVMICAMFSDNRTQPTSVLVVCLEHILGWGSASFATTTTDIVGNRGMCEASSSGPWG